MLIVWGKKKAFFPSYMHKFIRHNEINNTDTELDNTKCDKFWIYV